LTFVAAPGLIVAMSLLPFLKRFPDDEACWARLEVVRWPNGPVCPHYGAVDEAHSAGRAHDLRCNACNGKFRVTHRTPFEGTHLPLQNWFTALYLMAAASKGISLRSNWQTILASAKRPLGSLAGASAA
jgi:Transposase zinc-ribbon domain